MAMVLGAYRYFGLAGSSCILLAVCLSMRGYTGKRGEPYSIFNHYISELGEVGVARSAPIFNAGLMVGALLLMPFVVGLGLAIDNLWAKLGLLAGVGAAGACLLVGVFPMNKLALHTQAAMAYFRLGLATILFFGVSFMFQLAGREVVPWWANGFTVLSVLAYSSFLLLPVFRPVSEQALGMLNPEVLSQRPRFWWLATLEWLVFFSTMLWFLCVALVIKA